MIAIDTLPSDIQFEILVHFDNLQQLWCAVSSCRPLYQVFDQRRSLLLRQTFPKQLIQTYDRSIDISTTQKRHGRRHMRPLKDFRQELVAARAVIDRCRTTPHDALCLHEAVWNTFLSFDCSHWVECSWGQQLIDRCTALGKHDLALEYAIGLWNRFADSYLTRGSRTRQDNGLWAWCRQGGAPTDLAQKLVIMYLDAGRHEDALGVLRTFYEMSLDSKGYGLLSAVMGYYRKSRDLNELQLVPFFQERISKERTVVLADDRGRGINTAVSRFHWAHCLVMILMRADRHAEAIETMGDAIDLALRDSSNKFVPVGSSRKLIRMLQARHHDEEVLIVRQRVLDALKTTTATAGRPITSQFIAWSKEYTADLRSMHREEEALRIEEEMWTRLKDCAATFTDGDLMYHARNAAWTLAKSYRDRDSMDKAAEVRRDYEDIANALPNRKARTIQLLWPGSTPHVGLTMPNEQMNLPIMVCRREL